MMNLEDRKSNYSKIDAPCRVFGLCGGCLFQDVSYEDELAIKGAWLKDLLKTKLDWDDMESVVASSQEYHYRNRLDLKLARFKDGHIELGFSPFRKKNMMEISECFIARKEISVFLPQLKSLTASQLPADYREANIVVRSGDEKRVFWGGIGRRSLQQEEKNYFWTDIHGKRIFYSLDTFFQANLFILPKLMDVLRGFSIWHQDKIFFDLYGGVGLFGLNVYDLVKEVFLIEENKYAVKLAQYNINYHQLRNFHLVEGRVEDKLNMILENVQGEDHIAMIDPPRAGLSQEAVRFLNGLKKFKHLIYLSCHPESLIDNLSELKQGSWQIKRVIPFDFFPRTKHLETLVLLERKD